MDPISAYVPLFGGFVVLVWLLCRLFWKVDRRSQGSLADKDREILDLRAHVDWHKSDQAAEKKLTWSIKPLVIEPVKPLIEYLLPEDREWFKALDDILEVSIPDIEPGPLPPAVPEPQKIIPPKDPEPFWRADDVSVVPKKPRPFYARSERYPIKPKKMIEEEYEDVWGGDGMQSNAEELNKAAARKMEDKKYSYYEIGGEIVQRISEDGVVHPGSLKDGIWIDAVKPVDPDKDWIGPGGRTSNPYWSPEQVKARARKAKVEEMIKSAYSLPGTVVSKGYFNELSNGTTLWSPADGGPIQELVTDKMVQSNIDNLNLKYIPHLKFERQ